MKNACRSAVLNCVFAFLIIGVPLVPTTSLAHDARPIAVNVEQAQDFTVSIGFKVPGTLDARFKPAATLPRDCSKFGETPLISVDGAYVYERIYQCRTPLSGHTIGIEFPYGNPSLSSLLQITLPSGASHTKLLSPGDSGWLVPQEPSTAVVASDYTVLGISHIWRGVDHLLFVLCLLFIAGTKWRILATITGFTLAHSLTLALSTLGYFKVSVGAVEAIIALSIVFLAAEILRNNRQSLAWRKPMIVAVAFGLLHGLGFASVLADIGLPQSHRIQALIFFNVGVEIGQVLLIAIAMLAAQLLKGREALFGQIRLEPTIKAASTYAIGIVGSYWFVERSILALT